MAEGGLFNIIRGVPFTSFDRAGQPIWYTPGQGQLGAEGFVVGSMYVMFAATCYLLTNSQTTFGHLASSKSGGWFQQACYMLVAVGVLLVQRIVHFYTWKTGYQLRFYLLDWLLGIKG